jgi:hypothetical protein
VPYSQGGRPDCRAGVLLRGMILQHLYGLSDPQAEEQLKDRLSFQKFMQLDTHESVPDETTICRFRQWLIECGLHEQLLALLQEVASDSAVLGCPVRFAMGNCQFLFEQLYATERRASQRDVHRRRPEIRMRVCDLGKWVAVERVGHVVYLARDMDGTDHSRQVSPTVCGGEPQNGHAAKMLLGSVQNEHPKIEF